MGHVYIYGPKAEDLDCTGLCGALLPTECTHEEMAGGMSAVTLVHPFDEGGKWRHIKHDCILKCDTRVRTTPELEGGVVVTSVERWTVRDTATKNHRYVYATKKGGKKLKLLKPGTQVIVVKRNEEIAKVKTGKTTGYMSLQGLRFDVVETLPGNTDAIESVAPPWIVRSQLFRIQDVDVDTDSGTITAYAPHISYDLQGNNTRFKSHDPLTAIDALDGIMGGCDFETDFECHTDIGDERTSCNWDNISPVQALLDPDEGFLTRWGAELVRDDFELYFLHRAGRNRGARIEYAKNLLGVNYQTSNANVVTAIKPTGTKKDGSPLYLTDDEDSLDNYILAPHAGDYALGRAYVMACEDCKVDDAKIDKNLARKRMREQVARKFEDDKCDLPDVSLTVNFVQLGDTLEYQQYKDLEPVYLYDEVPVADKRHGIEVQTNVHRTVWDCLGERLLEIELGNVREGLPSIYSWQIPSLSGGKLDPGTVPGEALEDDTLPINKLDPDLVEALRKAWEDIETAQGMIDSANEWLDTLDYSVEILQAAVGDNAGNIAALQLTSEQIRAAVRDAESNIAVLEITANQVATALRDAEGNISTLQQKATETSSTIASMNGEISSIRQTANSVSSTVSTLNGTVASLVQQVASGVAIKLRDTSVNANYELAVRSAPEYSNWANQTRTCYGLEMVYNGRYYGGLFLDGADSSMGAFYQSLLSKGPQFFFSEGGVWIQSDDRMHPESYEMRIELGESYSVGKRLRCSEAWTVDSDRRLKHDIGEIDQGEALFDALLARQYRMAKDGPLHYGFIAQDVKAVMERLGIPETVMLSDALSDDKFMGLTYQEFIALTVHKVQRMQARYDAKIDALEQRISALEAKGGQQA